MRPYVHTHLPIILPQALAKGLKTRRDAKLSKLLPDDHPQREEIGMIYDEEPAIRLMRSMITEGPGTNGLVLVGISAYPAPVENTLIFPKTIDVSFEGRQHSVALTYTHFLLEDLVQPIPAETLHFASLAK